MLREHELIGKSDVLLLTELDYGMARSSNQHVARELARELEMAYAFAPCYVNLSKGSGLESAAAGENAEALHGNAVLSRWPIRRAWSVALSNGKTRSAKYSANIRRTACSREPRRRPAGSVETP